MTNAGINKSRIDLTDGVASVTVQRDRRWVIFTVRSLVWREMWHEIDLSFESDLMAEEYFDNLADVTLGAILLGCHVN